MLLGNDIVDLKEAEEKDERFLRRVFTRDELTAIQDSTNSTLALWILWSAKESAYKIAKKMDPKIVFSHQKFRIDAPLNGCHAEKGSIEAEMLYLDKTFFLRWEWNSDYLHCVAQSPRSGKWLAKVAAIQKDLVIESPALSVREEESVHSQASRAARLLAKCMAHESRSFKNLELIRERSGAIFLPPAFYEEGKPVSNMDLSLSHDGQYVAAVVSLEQ